MGNGLQRRADARIFLLTAGLLASRGALDASLSEPKGPNVLLVTIDTLRADRVGAYGSAAGATPNLDALAASGVVFEQAFTHTPVTLPAHATLFTGRLPFRHGVRSNTFYRLANAEITLAEILRDEGYRTAAFVSAAPVDRRFGLEQGFERYDDELAPPQPGALVAERAGAETVTRALEWLRKPRSGAFFLWVHLFDPHHPYEPPEPIRSRFGKAPYDGEVAASDEQVGRLVAGLAELGLRRDTLIVATSDHGESLGEHGEATHGIFLYDATLAVPLILTGPGVPVGARAGLGPVGLVDVLPTLLAKLKLSSGSVLDGRDLLGRGEPRALYAESLLPRDFYNWSSLRALREGETKFIEAPRPELYDLGDDPEETRNRLDERRPVALGMAAKLRALAEGGGSESRFLPASDLVARLESLGYLSGVVPAESNEREGPDPKDVIEVVARLDRAIAQLQRKELQQAATELRGILGDDPANYLATHYLGEALFELDRNKEARDVYRRLTTMRDSAYYRLRLGVVLERLGDFPGAATELERVLAIAPDAAKEIFGRALELREAVDPKAALLYLEMLERGGSGGVALYIALAETQDSLELEGEALASLDEGISRHGRDPRLVAARGRLLRHRGRAMEAIDLLEEAVPGLETPEERASALNLLGTLYGERESFSDAADRFERATELAPEDFEAWANLGLTRVRTGEVEGAIEPLSRALSLKPRETRLLNLLAEIRHRRGELDESLALLERSLSIEPQQPRLLEAVKEIKEKIQRR